MISVLSKSFSDNTILRNELLSHFKEVKFNDSGKTIPSTELASFLADSTAAIVALEPITSELLQNCPKLRAISKFGVGLDNVDFNACDKFGVKVFHEQGVNKRSVAELVLSLIISLTRNIHTSSRLLTHGTWKKDAGRQMSELTIGIIGVGHIGKELIKILKPFNCRIIVNDIIEQDKYYSDAGVTHVSKDELISKSDVVSLHIPMTSLTKGMINKDMLSHMKPTSFLVNTSRGGIVNESDLKNALEKNKIAGAALDVFEIEPATDKELLSLPNLICTPHIAGTANQAILDLGRAAIKNLINYYN